MYYHYKKLMGIHFFVKMIFKFLFLLISFLAFFTLTVKLFCSSFLSYLVALESAF